MATLQPFPSNLAVSAVRVMLFHYQFPVHKMPSILFSCLPPHAMYYVYYTRAYIRNVRSLTGECPYTVQREVDAVQVTMYF